MKTTTTTTTTKKTKQKKLQIKTHKLMNKLKFVSEENWNISTIARNETKRESTFKQKRSGSLGWTKLFLVPTQLVYRRLWNIVSCLLNLGDKISLARGGSRGGGGRGPPPPYVLLVIILLYINFRPSKLPTVPLAFSLISCPPPPPPHQYIYI